MPVEDVFSIKGRGTVATGRIEQGVVKLNDEVEIVGIKDTQKTVVTGIEAFHKALDKVKLATTPDSRFVVSSASKLSVVKSWLSQALLPLILSSKPKFTS